MPGGAACGSSRQLALAIVPRGARVERNRRRGRALEIERSGGGTRGEVLAQQTVDDIFVNVRVADEEHVNGDAADGITLIRIGQPRNERSLQERVPRPQPLSGRTLDLDQPRSGPCGGCY